MPDWSLSDIPGSVVIKAQQDPDFAVGLLHRDGREALLQDLDLDEDQLNQLLPILDEIAGLSFQEAIQLIRDQAGIGLA